MSYCRFMSQETADRYNSPDSLYSQFGPWQPSDLYVFEHVGGYMECCGCWLSDSRYFQGTDLEEFLAHVDEHIDAGHNVPADLKESLADDWPKEWMEDD